MRNGAFPNTPSYHLLLCKPNYDRQTLTDLESAKDLNFYTIQDIPPEGAYDPDRLLKSLPFRNADMAHVYRDAKELKTAYRTNGADVERVLLPAIEGVDTLVPNGRFVSRELGSEEPVIALLDKMKVDKGILTAKNVIVPMRDNDGDYGVVVLGENGASIERYTDALRAAKQPKREPKVA